MAGLVALIAALFAAAPTHAALPPVKHVFIVVLENKDYAETFGPNSKAPYLAKTLPAMGALLENYYGIGHESLDNYIAMVSGQGPNPQTQADCQFFTDFQGTTGGSDGQAMGTGCVYPAGVKTVADQLQEKGLTWHGYMEDMATPDTPTCRHPSLNSRDGTQSATAASQYAARHNPFVYFHSLIDGSSCKNNDVDLSHLPSDLSQAGTTPSYSFITPDLCHDGHDATCADPKQKGGLDGIQDFLSTWVPQILASPGYKDNGMLIVTFDEAENGDDSSACCGETAANTPSAGGPNPGPGGGRVGAVVVSPFVRPGTIDKTPYNHYSLLRTVEDLFGLPHLGYAAADGLAPIGANTFNQVPKLSLTVKARRMNRNHIRFAIDAERQATVVFGGVCKSASPRPTSELGLRTITVRYARGGRCRVAVSRPGWETATKSFRLRRPR